MMAFTFLLIKLEAVHGFFLPPLGRNMRPEYFHQYKEYAPQRAIFFSHASSCF